MAMSILDFLFFERPRRNVVGLPRGQRLNVGGPLENNELRC